MLSVALSGCATIETAPVTLSGLDELVTFTGAAVPCQFGAPLDRVVSGLAIWDERAGRNRAGPPLSLAGADRPVVPRLSRIAGGYFRARAELRAPWRGLTVTGVETIFMPETDDISHFVTFAEPRGRALTVLNANGFELDPGTGSADREVVTPDETATVTLFLEPRGRGSALGCAHNY